MAAFVTKHNRTLLFFLWGIFFVIYALRFAVFFGGRWIPNAAWWLDVANIVSQGYIGLFLLARFWGMPDNNTSLMRLDRDMIVSAGWLMILATVTQPPLAGLLSTSFT